MELMRANDNGVYGLIITVEVFEELQISIRCKPH